MNDWTWQSERYYEPGFTVDGREVKAYFQCLGDGTSPELVALLLSRPTGSWVHWFRDNENSHSCGSTDA